MTEPKLIGKHPEEETYVISMDGTINPHTSFKVYVYRFLFFLLYKCTYKKNYLLK